MEHPPDVFRRGSAACYFFLLCFPTAAAAALVQGGHIHSPVGGALRSTQA